LAAALAFASACVEDGPEPPAPVFPPDAAQTWTEMRDCRFSHEHELRRIRVFANELAEGPYAALSEEVPYPVGAVLVKAEYDDENCAELIGWTAMRKEPAGTWPEGNDWTWQDLDVAMNVEDEGSLPQCIGCHTDHCAPPFGYDLTCAEEL
jgi:hypothetical protein